MEWVFRILVLATLCHICIRAVKSYLSPEPLLRTQDAMIVSLVGTALYFVIAFALLTAYGVI